MCFWNTATVSALWYHFSDFSQGGQLLIPLKKLQLVCGSLPGEGEIPSICTWSTVELLRSLAYHNFSPDDHHLSDTRTWRLMLQRPRLWDAVAAETDPARPLWTAIQQEVEFLINWAATIQIRRDGEMLLFQDADRRWHWDPVATGDHDVMEAWAVEAGLVNRRNNSGGTHHDNNGSTHHDNNGSTHRDNNSSIHRDNNSSTHHDNTGGNYHDNNGGNPGIDDIPRGAGQIDIVGEMEDALYNAARMARLRQGNQEDRLSVALAEVEVVRSRTRARFWGWEEE